MQLPIRGFYAGANIKAHSTTDLAGCAVESIHHIVDIDIVAGISSVTEYLGWLSRQQSLGENSNHTGLAVRILPRAVHIRRRDVRAFEPVKVAEHIQVQFARRL